MEEIMVMTYGHKYWGETVTRAEQCSWKAGPLLAQKMRENDFESNERVMAAIIDGAVAGFCTFTNKDELPEEFDFTPFVGFMFVEEKYRGNRLSERLINAACSLAEEQGYKEIYIMSGEIGLYEKYGFTKIGEYKTIYGTVDWLFLRKL